MLSDGELLRRYAEEGAEDAFRALVARHIHGVYRAALRRVGGNAHAADDVTQRVFTDLARKAKTLRDRPNLAGWLYTGTRFAAAEVVRAEQRRRTHEQEAHTMHELNAPEPVDHLALAPVLDEILDALGPDDRDAVVLHFLEGLTFAEVGEALSLTGDAARMRVNRALERLRAELGRRGVVSTATALGTVLSAQVGISAPAALVSGVAGQALAAAAVPAVAPAGTLLPVLSVFGVMVAALGLYFWQPWQAPVPPAPAVVSLPVRPSSRPQAVPAPGEVTSLFEEATAFLNQAPVSLGNMLMGETIVFAGLSDDERSVLKKLGRIRESRGDDLGWGFNVAEQTPSYGTFAAGRDRLIARGLVRTNGRGGAFLQEAGRTFLDAHAGELAALPDYWPAEVSGPAAGSGPDFATLSEPEKNVLKRLRDLEAKAPQVPGRVFGLTIPETNPGRVLLLERGWLAAGQQGGVHLTPAGRAFVTANQEAIDAHVLTPPPATE